MNKYILKLLLLVFVLSALENMVVGQINAFEEIARQLQSGQITEEEAIKKARAKGMTEEEIEQYKRSAYQRGYSKEDLILDTLGTFKIDTIDLAKEITVPVKTEKEEYKKYFGYDLFIGPPAKFEVSQFGPIDPNYQLGPGDEIIISLWGETEKRYKLKISREGTIFIERYGQMVVNGLTLELLEEKLIKNLSKIYNSLNPTSGSPTTFLDVSLGKLRSIKIFVLGELKNPGAYFISTYSTIFTALYQVGGPSITGSLRDIRVIRNNKVITNLDLYEFIITGKGLDDISLQNNDIIFIPPRLNSISLQGEVKKELIYELKENEGLEDIITFSGGLKPTVDIKNVQITRVLPFKERITKGKIIDIIDTSFCSIVNNEVNINNIRLYDQDIITIFPMVDNANRQLDLPGGTKYVSISGHILNPGRYILENDMNINDLLIKGGGIDDPFFWGETYQVRADLIRYNEDGLTQNIIPIKLNKLIEGDQKENIKLQNKDSLIIYNASIIHFKDAVTIEGEVKNPGTYIAQKNLRIHDLILQAGGFTKEAYKYIIEVYRIDPNRQVLGEMDTLVLVHWVDITPEMLDKVNNDGDFPLKDRDLVVVRHHPNFENQRVVTLTGEVKFPGKYAILEKNETLNSLIERSGSFTNEAFIAGIKYYRNNTQEIVGDFEKAFTKEKDLNIKLQDGDFIHIPKYPGTVKVNGLVNNPGFVQFQTGWDLRKYIEAAGDFAVNANKRKTVIYYPGGAAKKRKFFIKPRVKEGSVIYVPQKPEKEPVNTTQLITNIVQITASLATTALIIVRFLPEKTQDSSSGTSQ